MQWYYSKNSTQHGPVSEEELRAKIATGEVTGSDLAWCEGMADWKPIAGLSQLTQGPAVETLRQPHVPSSGSPYAPPVAAPNYSGAIIPNYLWQSIVVTIFCCWPFGIPAIVYAAKVDGLKARGDIAGAMAASSSAKTWCMVALGSWVVVIVIYLLIFAAGYALQ